MRRVLTVQNTAGSVEHYYHFFFAVLIPLLDRIRSGTLQGVSVLRSCGPMDRHLQLLQDQGLAQFRLLRKDLISNLLMRTPHHLVEPLHSQECYNASGVRKDGYMPEVLRRVREFGIQCFAKDAPALDVLMVERGEPNPFYLSSRTEMYGGGSERRSIPNSEEIADALNRSGREITRLRLETLELAEQIRTFSRARVVVAQHGAALSNVLWMASDSHVVEIVPQGQRQREHFSRIATIVGASYATVHQDDNHAPVNPEAVLKAVRTPTTCRKNFIRRIWMRSITWRPRVQSHK